MNIPSFKKRYASKLGTNIAGVFIGLATVSITARVLGPEALGRFSFITGFFLQLIPIITFSTSMAFFSKISQRPKEIGLISYYVRILIGAGLIAVSLAIVVDIIGFSAIIWPGQSFRLVILGLVFLVLILFEKMQTSLADAYGLTIKAEAIKLLRRLLMLLLIVVAMRMGVLDLENYFYIHFIMMALVIITIFILIKVNVGNIYRQWSISKEARKKYFTEFYSYSSPLVMSTVFTSATLIFDRWLLQFYGGDIQQGYFAISEKISSVSLIFITAIISLFIREISIYYNNRNFKAIKSLLNDYLPILYLVTSIVSVFFIINAHHIINIVGGKDFTGANTTMLILSFYPIHQSLGQIAGALYLGSSKTTLYRNINIVFAAAGVVLTYILLVPDSAFNLNLGASGLAIKLVIIQVIKVNVLLFMFYSIIGASFKKLLVLQFFGILIPFVSAFLGREIIGLINNLITLNMYVYLLLVFLAQLAITIVLIYLGGDSISFPKEKIRQSIVKYILKRESTPKI